jgi:peptidoglycan/LPS O-acetylase OafA/YrhL
MPAATMQGEGRDGAAARGGEFFPSIAWMRAFAALIVVYDHLIGVWPERNGVTWAPAQFANRWLFDPLNIMAHGGIFGVALFFMVSGFVIVYVGQRETVREFAIKRALRIYPPLWVSIALLLAAYATAFALSDTPGLRGYAIEVVLGSPDAMLRVLAAMSLGNYLIGTPPVNGVAWTLIVEVLFYLSIALLLPLLRARPRTAIVVAWLALALLQAVARANTFMFLLAVNMTYVTYMFLGSLVYLRWAGRIGNGFLVVGSVAFAGLFLRGMAGIVVAPPFTFAQYVVSFSLAWLVFVVLLRLDRRIRLGRITTFFSRISYSLYLNHGGLGMLALTLLYPRIGYPAALAVAFALGVGVAAASWRWVEVPSQRLARRWAGRAEAPV